MEHASESTLPMAMRVDEAPQSRPSLQPASERCRYLYVCTVAVRSRCAPLAEVSSFAHDGCNDAPTEQQHGGPLT
jgi:hypothetical protein